MLSHFLNQLYPFGGDFRKKITQNILIGIFVAFFLIVFQPFNIDIWVTDHKWLKLGGYGLVAFVAPMLTYWATLWLHNEATLEQKWTVWREIVHQIVMLCLIAVGNMLYSNWLGVTSISFYSLTFWAGTVLLLGIFPITGIILAKYERFRQINSATAHQINDLLPQYQEQPLAPSGQAVIQFVADNDKDRIEVAADALLYIESADNYSCFVFLKNGQVQKQLLRGALRRFEEQAADYTNLMRCHRSYIVNLHVVNDIKGNAQGYRLSLPHTDQQVPVARNYGPVILAQISGKKAPV